MKFYRLALAAITLAALPVAAQAYDNKPTKPPVSGGGNGGSSGGTVAVPAPGAVGLFAVGVAGLAVARRRRRR